MKSMKKIISFSIAIILILASFTKSYASSGHYTVELKTQNSTVKAGDNFDVYIYVSNFNDVGEGVDTATGTLKFDNTALEFISCSAENSWPVPSTNISNENEIVFESTGRENTIKENGNILKFTFKVLDSATTGTTAVIELTKLDLAYDNDYDEEKLDSLSININNGTSDDEKKEEQPEAGTADDGKDELQQGEITDDEKESDESGKIADDESEEKNEDGKEDDESVAPVKEIPQAGDGVLFMSIVAIVLICAIIALVMKLKKTKDII